MAVAALVLWWNRSSARGNVDFNNLNEPVDSLNAINNLYQVLNVTNDPNTGMPISTLQIKLLLSQALTETGLFTDYPNWTLVDGNNFSGIVAHGNYPPNINGRFAKYTDIPAFVNDWIRILNSNVHPIEAKDVNDFNERLQTNGYYGSDNSVVYGNNLTNYFNLLSQVI
ncbi:MAG: hypothetical protein ACREOZ_02640 [Gloeomargaritales cyanobacterium]